MPIEQSRRRFLGQLGIAGVAGMGGLASAGLGGGTRSFAAEPPPEITTIRFEKDPGTCIAPQAAEELLRAEGFTDIRYVDLTEARVRRAAASGADFVVDMIDHDEVDFGRAFAPGLVIGMGAGAPVTVLAGLHLGCFEIFGKENIRTHRGPEGQDDRGIRRRQRRRRAAENHDQVWSGSIRPRISVGSPVHRSSRWTSSSQGKIDAFLAGSASVSRKCAPGTSAM